MEELLILQEEHLLEKSRNFYNSIFDATEYINFTKNKKPERDEKESRKYEKKSKKELIG